MKTTLKRMMTAVLAALFLYPAESRGKEGVVQCGNLIYAGTQTSRCFSDEFLSTVQQKTSISTSRRFRAVRLDNEELFRFPFVVMTGEGDFVLTARERENLKNMSSRAASCWPPPGAPMPPGTLPSAGRCAPSSEKPFSSPCPCAILFFNRLQHQAVGGGKTGRERPSGRSHAE